MITAIAPSSPVFTSALSEMQFSLSGGASHARIVLTCHGTTLIDADYYADDDGLIVIGDLDTLLSDELRMARRSTLTVTATDDTGHTWSSGPIDVIYCTADMDVSATAFINSHFLTLLQGAKTTAAGRTELLSATGTDAGAATVTACYAKNGATATIVSALAPVSENNGIYKYMVCPSDYIDAAQGTLYRLTVTCGDRTTDLEMTEDAMPPAPQLLFTNSFGCQELFYCKGEHQASPKYDRKAARIGLRKRNYHIDETRTFNADTGMLTTIEANWADDLFRSDEIYLWDGTAPQKEVVITESKSERTNDADEQPRFTFSYEYSQRNHNVLQTRRGGRIFDNTFDDTFN